MTKHLEPWPVPFGWANRAQREGDAGMTVPVILLVLGGVCLLAALFGGITGTYSLHTLSPALRILAGFLSLVFLAGGAAAFVWSESNKKPEDKASSAPPPASREPSPIPSHADSPTPPPPTINPIKYEKDFTISYIDNTGHMDIDEPRAWNGDVTEADDVPDFAINPDQVSSENFAKIALSRSGAKQTCTAAIKLEAPTQISIGQVKDDNGFCVESNRGLLAYVMLKEVRSANADHAALIHVTAFR